MSTTQQAADIYKVQKISEALDLPPMAVHMWRSYVGTQPSDHVICLGCGKFMPNTVSHQCYDDGRWYTIRWDTKEIEIAGPYFEETS